MERPAYYSFHPVTHQYAGSGWCDASPREAGVWLIPGCATTHAPPDGIKAGHVAVYREETQRWHQVEDHRGELVWHDGNFGTVTSLGPLKALGLEPLQVHGAQYLADPQGSSAGELGRIRVWINDDVIDIVDIANSVQRRVVAAWEAAGETIRPADEPVYAEPEPVLEEPQPEEPTP